MNKLIFFNAKKAEALQLPLSLDIQHFYKSADNTIVDGLISNVNDSGSSANADFAQAVAINQPQFGYDKVGNFVANAANLTFDGSNFVSNWANVLFEPNSRALGALTQTTAGAKPLWDSGEECLVFASGKSFNITTIAKNVKAFSEVCYVKIPTVSDAILLNQPIYFFRKLNSNNGVHLYLSRNGAQTYVLVAGVGNGSFFNTIKLYTETQINSLFADWTLITLRFQNGKLDLLFNETQVATTTSATVTNMIFQANASLCISNGWGIDGFKVKSIQTFDSYLSDSEIALLYMNRNNPTYELPRQGLISTGNSFMRNTLVLNQNNEITVGGYVYFPSLVSGTFTEILISTDTVNKGFQLKIIRSGSNLYFNFTCWNGATAMEANSAAITLTNFNSLYANKFSQIAGIFNFGKVSVLVQQAALGSATYAPTQFEQSTNSIITLMGVNNASSLSAGIRIEGVFITESALSATQLLLRKEIDVINLPHVA